ncbi:MAG: sigma-70 family RNA polymerase sigma factor [Planctomycetia bacterium]|nr:sigma-70 family RNA polymerase sigma factor [Planctomycetia bacterium]
MSQDNTLHNSPYDDEDARLMLAVQANDAFAFEELMSRNQARVCAFMQRLVGNSHTAEDLTQEVFMRVYKHRATYRHEAKFSTWLYRIAHNVAYNELRSRSRRPEALFSSMSSSTSMSTKIGFEDGIVSRSGATPTRKIAQLELQAVVRAAIDALGPRQREVIMLSRFEGMNYQQIANVMNLTPQAVKSLLSRARLNLKEALAPYVNQGKRP